MQIQGTLWHVIDVLSGKTISLSEYMAMEATAYQGILHCDLI